MPPAVQDFFAARGLSHFHFLLFSFAARSLVEVEDGSSTFGLTPGDGRPSFPSSVDSPRERLLPERIA